MVIDLNGAKAGDRVRITRTYEGVLATDEHGVSVQSEENNPLRYWFAKSDTADTTVELVARTFVVGSVYVDVAGVPWMVVTGSAAGLALRSPEGAYQLQGSFDPDDFRLVYTPGRP